MRNLFLSLRRLRRDPQGTSIIELAIFLPFMMALIVGIIDLSTGIATRANLQKAVNRTLEMVVANSPTVNKDASTMNFSYLKPEAAAAAGVEEEDVEIVTWLECDGVEEASTVEDDGTVVNENCDPGETMARYLQLRVEFLFTPMFEIGPVGAPVNLFAESAVRIQ